MKTVKTSIRIRPKNNKNYDIAFQGTIIQRWQGSAIRVQTTWKASTRPTLQRSLKEWNQSTWNTQKKSKPYFQIEPSTNLHTLREPPLYHLLYNSIHLQPQSHRMNRVANGNRKRERKPSQTLTYWLLPLHEHFDLNNVWEKPRKQRFLFSSKICIPMCKTKREWWESQKTK